MRISVQRDIREKLRYRQHEYEIFTSWIWSTMCVRSGYLEHYYMCPGSGLSSGAGVGRGKGERWLVYCQLLLPKMGSWCCYQATDTKGEWDTDSRKHIYTTAAVLSLVKLLCSYWRSSYKPRILIGLKNVSLHSGWLNLNRWDSFRQI